MAPYPGLNGSKRVEVHIESERYCFFDSKYKNAGRLPKSSWSERVTAEEVKATWRKGIAHSKVVKESRIGYSFGLNYPSDWGEHTISVRPGVKTVLQPSMMLHLIPGIWYDEVGFEVDASVKVTPEWL